MIRSLLTAVILVALASSSTSTYARGTCDVQITQQACIGGPTDTEYDSNSDWNYVVVRFDYTSTASVSKKVYVKVTFRNSLGQQVGGAEYEYTVPANGSLTEFANFQDDADVAHDFMYVEIETGFEELGFGFDEVGYDNCYWSLD